MVPTPGVSLVTVALTDWSPATASKYVAAGGERRCIHVQRRVEAVQLMLKASESAARRLNEKSGWRERHRR